MYAYSEIDDIINYTELSVFIIKESYWWNKRFSTQYDLSYCELFSIYNYVTILENGWNVCDCNDCFIYISWSTVFFGVALYFKRKKLETDLQCEAGTLDGWNTMNLIVFV